MNQKFQYELWSDTDRALAMHYGAAKKPDANYPSRITVVLDDKGDLLLSYTDRIKVGAHPSEVLEDVKKLLTESPSPKK